MLPLRPPGSDSELEFGRYSVTGATRADLEPLLALARHLNTVNLPHDRAHLTKLLDCSELSFRGELAPPHRKYVFLLWDEVQGRAVGSSSIIAQLGRRDAPYIYFDVIEEQRYSSALDRHFHHSYLRLGFSYEGPTELGGLVIEPSYRRAPERLGRFISYMRFAFIAAQRDLFQKQLLAELLPPLLADGRSHLWEALGRRFTGMTYAEADLMSSHDKDFIRDLFPRGDIYTTLLDDEARAVIGQVGEQTRGVERMLHAVGFRYARRVDPFDGGPHFVAQTDDVPLIQSARALLQPQALNGEILDRQGLVLSLESGPPFARACLTEVSSDAPDVLPAVTLERLAAHGLAAHKREHWVIDWP
jgi:arginine N-succinyltransferase